jgi:hypothetical protein
LVQSVNFSPELQLLIAVARVELRPQDENALSSLLSAAVDWDRLLTLATGHGLEPLLFHHLSEQSADLVPVKLLQALRAGGRESARRGMILASRLQGISDHLDSHEIDHILYKGPLFAEVYYGNCALRVFHDLDVIVPPGKIVATRNALAEIGFIDRYGLDEAQQAAAFRFGSQHIFTAPGGLDLDLHWRIIPKSISRSLDMGQIWKRATTASFFGRDVPTLCAEDMLVVLCLHAGQHEWARLSTLCDVSQLLLHHPDLNWEIVRSQLRDSNTIRMIDVSLFLVSQHWPVQIPTDFAARISADHHIAGLAEKIQSELWPEPELEANLQSQIRWLMARTAGENFGDRFRFLAGNMLGPTLSDFETFRLPRMLFTLYPALRGVRLAFKYATPSRTKKSGPENGDHFPGRS